MAELNDPKPPPDRSWLEFDPTRNNNEMWRPYRVLIELIGWALCTAFTVACILAALCLIAWWIGG